MKQVALGVYEVPWPMPYQPSRLHGSTMGLLSTLGKAEQEWLASAFITLAQKYGTWVGADLNSIISTLEYLKHRCLMDCEIHHFLDSMVVRGMILIALDTRGTYVFFPLPEFVRLIHDQQARNMSKRPNSKPTA